MTDCSCFTQEELEELLNALDTHRDHLSRVYSTFPNADWKARDARIRELKTKIIGMRT